ncbi:hypothetical protein TSUD_268580 [Trifolium subterraneum]|uniref:Uncharacterized protein n=1 Tax=Trifolium subterraneum TaxID=3900 RepID=A0A2Z6PMM2_TRISU|nr:hypothetical protein TSUD_268580 [Trifolium subterraneum]
MAAMASSFSNIHTHSFSLPNQNHHSSTSLPLPTLSIISRPPHSHSKSILFTSRSPITAIYASTNDDKIGGEGGSGSGGGGGGGGGGDNGDGESEDRDRNREESLLVLAEVGKPLDYLPADLAEAVKAGRVPGSIVKRFFELEKSSVFRWLLNFGGFRERLLADDLFLAKVAMECGVGIFTKTAAELEKRKENFTKELDFVCADVVMAIVADFMLVWLPAPTVSLRPPPSVSAGVIAKFFFGCPENAFQIGTGVTNALINARKVVDKSFADEAEEVPVLSTSAAYGVYMAVSSNLRYQILAGIIEQRILDPLLHRNKLLLSAICFAVRTGNTFLGSLLWVDYARWVGVQKIRD